MDQTQEPIKLHHQPSEEEEHHENGASKMFRKVKAKAKKIKNSLTKHGQSHEQDHDVVDEGDEGDELEPEAIGAPVRSGVTSQPESLNHPREANVPAPEEIIPPGTKVFPVVSSDYTKPPLQDVSYGHEAPHSVRTNDISDKEERSEAPIHQPLSELSDREERPEAHQEGLNTPVSSLLSATEDTLREDEYLGGQRKVNAETPKNLEDDSAVTGGGSEYPSGDISGYQSKVTDPTKEGFGFETDFLDKEERREAPIQRHEGMNTPVSLLCATEDVTGTFSPGGEDEYLGELGGKFPATSNEFDQKTKFGVNKSSPTRNHEFDVKNESSIDKNSPSRSHEFDLQTESAVENILRVGFDSDSGAEIGKEFSTERREFDQKNESGRNGNSPMEFGGGLGGNFPVGSQEVCLKDESEIGKDSPTGFGRESGEDFPAKGSHEYGEKTEDYLPTRNDDVKVETELGRGVPTGTHDQFSPELSRPKERDDFEETRDNFEETRNETKPSTYTEQSTSVKNGVASKLGNSGETPVKDETEVAHEKLNPVEDKDTETESTVTTKLPFSGSGNGVEETEHVEDKGVSAKDDLSEEDKALSEVLAEKVKIGGGEEEKKEIEVKVEKIPTKENENSEAVAEEEKAAGGGMVGMIKGWFGGGPTEEVKPKLPHSVQESSQSLDTTVGTKELSEFGGSESGATDGHRGVVPVQREL